MRVSTVFHGADAEAVKAALDGGRLDVFVYGRLSVVRTGDGSGANASLLARFRFASPAFDADGPGGLASPRFVEVGVEPLAAGRPGFARAFDRHGRPVADFTVGPGLTEVKLTETLACPGRRLAVASFWFGDLETVETAETAPAATLALASVRRGG